MDMNKIRIVENSPVAEDYLHLRESLSWNTYSLADTKIALSNNLYCVSIYYEYEIIGMGRIVGDGRVCFYIQDIMVKPTYQNHGIGTLILNHIIEFLKNIAAKEAYIGLMSKKGKEEFYENFGFIKRPNDIMGNGMVLPHFDPKK